MTSTLNNSIRTLTVLTILLTIPTIVSSLYGMNVPLPLAGNPLAFWMVAVAILIAVAIVTLLFKKKDWF